MRGAEQLLSIVVARWRFEAFPIDEVDDELERLERLDAQPLPGKVRRRVYKPRHDWIDREELRAAASRAAWPEPAPMLRFYGPPPPPAPLPEPSPDWLLTPHERIIRAGGR